MIVELECVVPDGTDLAGVQVWPYVQHFDGETETTKLDGTTVVLPVIPSNTDVTFRLRFYGQDKVAFDMTGYTATLTSRRRSTSADPVFSNLATIDGVTTNLMECLVSRDQTADEGSRTNIYGVLIVKTATDRADEVLPESHMQMRRVATDPDAVVTTAGPDMVLVGLPTVGAGQVGQYLRVADNDPLTLEWVDLPPPQTPTAVKTSAYTAAAGDIVRCDASGGAFTVTLPTAVGATAPITVKKTTSDAGAVTVATTSAQTIDGDATRTVDTPYASETYVSDGANWMVLG